jgi:nitrite reductase (NADH) small subunit
MDVAAMEMEEAAGQTRPWVRACTLEDIPRLGARVVVTAQGNIAVFRTADDQVFALLDRCPHKGGPLSQGIVFGRKVACPLHGWNLCLDTGQAVPPDEGCAPVYPVKVEEGVIFLQLCDPGALR